MKVYHSKGINQYFATIIGVQPVGVVTNSDCQYIKKVTKLSQKQFNTLTEQMSPLTLSSVPGIVIEELNHFATNFVNNSSGGN